MASKATGQGDWENVLCVTIKGRAVLFTTIIEGGKSWEHLRTWNSQVFATFKEACMARGLLEDDHEWRICLEEVIAV